MSAPPTETPREAQSVSRRPLVVLSLLFVVPLAIAFILYYGGSWRPAKNTQHGELIHPARPLPEIALATIDGGETAPKFLQERWSLLFVGDGRCDERCKNALADMQRAREMLGKDIFRVQSVFLVSESCCDREFLKSTYPNLMTARLDAEAVAPQVAKDVESFIATFPTYESVPATRAGRIYIVDPLGNLMMSYPAAATGIGMYEDLKTLLKLSHIG